jgi:hypothetical protein
MCCWRRSDWRALGARGKDVDGGGSKNGVELREGRREGGCFEFLKLG